MGRLLGSPREVRQFAPEPPIPPFPGIDVFGNRNPATNPESALFLSTVWACVTLIANTVSVMPLETFRRPQGINGVPARASDSQFVLNPQADMTQSAWLHMVMVSALLRGNTYGLKVGLTPMGFPQQIVLLDPAQVIVRVNDDTGAIQYLVGKNRLDKTAQIWHMPGLLTLPGKRVGLSPVAYAAETIGLDRAARKFAMDFFSNGGMPISTLTSDMPINQEQATTLKQRFLAATRNREPIALGSGVTFAAHGVKPDESQFLETQQTNIARIAQFFGVPAEMVGGKTGSSLTYNTVEMNNQTFLDQAIRPWLKRIEDAFSLLLPSTQMAQFDISQLLRTDAESQAKVDAIDIAAKIVAPSEKRTNRGLPPLTEPQKEELELIPLTINIGTGLPKALPNPPTPETDDDSPVVGTPPAVPGQPTPSPAKKGTH